MRRTSRCGYSTYQPTPPHVRAAALSVDGARHRNIRRSGLAIGTAVGCLLLVALILAAVSGAVALAMPLALTLSILAGGGVTWLVLRAVDGARGSV